MLMKTHALVGTRFAEVARMGYLKIDDLEAVLVRYEANRKRHYMICDRSLGVRIGGVTLSVTEAYESALKNAINFQRQLPMLSRFFNK